MNYNKIEMGRYNSVRIFALLAFGIILALGCLPAAPTASNTPARVTLPPITFPATPTTSQPLTASLHPTFTPTMISPPAWVPSPTLSPDDANAKVLDLLQNNAGCVLPCWWGITPGETDEQTALQFLETFALNISQIIGQKIEEGGIPILESSYRVYYQEPDQVDESDMLIDFRNSIASNIFVDNRYFSVSKILSDSGAPTHIWLGIWPGFSDYAYEEFHADDVIFVMLLIIYPQQGILAAFVDREFILNEEQDTVRACFYTDESFLELTPPDPENTEYGNSPERIYARDIDVLTNMDIQSFYETFKNPNTEPCIEIFIGRYGLPN